MVARARWRVMALAGRPVSVRHARFPFCNSKLPVLNGCIIIAKGNASFLVTAKGRSRENPPRTLTPWSARARTALRPSANRPGSPYGLAPQFRLGVRGDFRPRGLLFAKHVIFRLVVTAVTPLISPSQTAYLRYQGARTGPKGEKRVPGLRCSAGPGPGFSHYRAFWVLRVTGAP